MRAAKGVEREVSVRSRVIMNDLKCKKWAEPSKNSHLTLQYGGRRWRSWLRHCATRRKVEGSIPDGVIGIFH